MRLESIQCICSIVWSVHRVFLKPPCSPYTRSMPIDPLPTVHSLESNLAKSQDHIRKSFHPEYYKVEDTGIHGILHRGRYLPYSHSPIPISSIPLAQNHSFKIQSDHCIDSLRQMIMCNADITPLPTRWYPNVTLGDHTLHYVDSDRPHTCRSWDAVREWVTDRHAGPNAVQPWHMPGHEEDYLHF